MQIGSQSGISSANSVGVQPTRIGGVQDPPELNLEELSPTERAAVRSYLAQVDAGVSDLREASPFTIPGLSPQEHEQMQHGYREMTDGGNIFKLLNERSDIKDKISNFVNDSKNKIINFPFPPVTQTATEPSEIVLRAFDRWDANHDGGLDRDELGRALQDPQMTPEEGAAFAIIYERCISPRRDEQNPANSEPNFLEDGKVTREEIQSVTGRSASYQRALDKINASPNQAFIGPPDGDAVVQGRHGSCSLLAALIAMAENDPAAVQRMIRDNGDQSWTVTFPGKEPVRVTLSPAERALGASSNAQGGNNGLWVAILEKAYAMVEAGPNSNNPLSIYEDGENAGHTASVLSGQEMERVGLGAGNIDSGFIGDIQVGVMEMRVRARLERALLDGRPITCALFNTGNPWGLPASHAYTVLNMRGDNLTIRNPWGDSVSGEGNPDPNNPRQPVDGNADGRVTVSLSDFVRWFSEVNC